MIKKILREKIFCGLDLGSKKIKAAVLRVNNPRDIEIIDVQESDTHGFKNASVQDLGELSECVHSILSSLSKKIKVKLKEIQLGVNGDLIDVRQATTAIPLIDKGSKIITSRDIKRVSDQNKLLGTKMEEEILHDLPQAYKIDDDNLALNPIGLYGRKLSASSLMILSSANRVRNITRSVHHAGYDVVNLMYSSYVASDVALDEEQKLAGCVLVDIGSTVTSILVFKEGIIRYVNKISFGGNNFTEGISRKINLPFDLSESIKKAHAVVTDSDQRRDEEILIKRENSYVPIKKKEIYQAIEPESQCLIETIQDSIKNSGLFDQINSEIVMVGGGSLLPGLVERIGKEVNLPTKLGKINISKGKQHVNSSFFAQAVGLAYIGFKRNYGYDSALDDYNLDFKRKVIEKFKELYHEYF
ncbi:MAG: cell division protein FtsA [Candidatus Zapsychrus exili]|nr:cell division protein FtsA [Candidatus Zapsychrus exili]